MTFDPYDGSIRARLVKGEPSAMGLESIKVYRLSRTALSRARKSWARRVAGHLLLTDLARRNALNKAQRKVVDLLEQDMRDPQQPYQGLTRQIMRENRRQRRSRQRARHT